MMWYYYHEQPLLGKRNHQTEGEQLIMIAIHRPKEAIHSFIADIYIAPLQVGLLRSAPNPSAAE